MIKKNNKNIHLYFGDDDFTIAEEISKEKEAFEKKSGGINIHEIDWNDQNLSKDEKMTKLQDALMSGSLFSSDKLLIIKNSLFPIKTGVRSLERNKSQVKQTESSYRLKPELQSSDEKDKLILKYFENIQEGIKIFFIEENLDKRKKIYKELIKLERSGIASMKEFLVPIETQFENWIKNRIEKRGGKISKEALNNFAIILGKGLAQKDRSGKVSQSYNLWETSSEIEKLLNYCDGNEIEKNDIESLVRSKVDMNIFNLIDSISSKNKSKAALLLNKQIEEGLNENYVLTMFVYQFRNLIRIKSLLDQGLANNEIISQTKMHPYVVQKSIQQCQGFEIETLKKIYQKLFDADLAIKSGKIQPRLALDLLVVSIA